MASLEESQTLFTALGRPRWCALTLLHLGDLALDEVLHRLRIGSAACAAKRLRIGCTPGLTKQGLG